MMVDDEHVNDKPISRRQLLVSLGAAGIAAAAGAVFPNEVMAATTDSVYFNVKDYGAKGTGRMGENDAVFIQSAIDAASPTGGTVFLPPGKYNIKSAIQLKSNVRLLGAGAEASVIKIDYDANGISMVSSLSEINYFAVEHLTFEGTGVPTGSSSYIQTERGILLQGVKNGLIANCIFKTIVNGVHLNNTTNVTVTGCTFRNVIGDGANEGIGVLCQSGSSVLIEGNRFKNVYKSGVQLQGGCSSAIITGNWFDGCRSAAVNVMATETSCSENIIAGNTITSSETDSAGPYGIFLSGYCVGNTIAGNLISKATKAGIRAAGAASAETERPTANKIIGNTLKAVPTGVELLNADDNTVTNNDFRNVDDGVVIDASADGVGGYSRRNYAVNNGFFQFAKNAVRIVSSRCEANGAFGNFGSGSGANLTDKGTGTATVGF
ncbi:right-handed parallel beta-helix repeat-containing protein [Paenibacillus thalictri]|nr:glycosyl hydrolase family 28-related protein [Paenibacillus thalictri]